MILFCMHIWMIIIIGTSESKLFWYYMKTFCSNTTKVNKLFQGAFVVVIVSSSPAHGEVYSIQYYVTKFVSDLRQVDGFRRQ